MNGTKSSPETIKVADYLFTRLRQLGIYSIFGVPGDYNLRLLDFVEPSGLHWVGNCNELNAAYAADGYARINGFSALITTYGVGEISAINGIAGAFTEKAAVIHIVGTPERRLQDSRALVHHTMADGEYRHFATMAAHVTKAQVNLVDSQLVPDQIDWVLKQAMIYSQPVYIELPDDMADVTVVASNLRTLLSCPKISYRDDEPMKKVLDRIYNAQQPLILVDGECRPMGIAVQVEELVKTTGWPTWTTIFGKSLICEELPNVYGNYTGSLGIKDWKAYFDSADLIVVFGPHYTDTNSQNFSTIPKQSVSITFSRDTIQIGHDVHHDIPSCFMSRLVHNLDRKRIPRVEGPSKFTDTVNYGQPDPGSNLAQKTFYRFVDRIFRPGDLILTETGTASHGGREFSLPSKTRLFGAVTWLSIGYMLPATLGAALAKRDQKEQERAILFIGDGSLQMSAQEIGTIIKEKLNVIMFIINNDGYTIERAIHGRKQAYNDIAPWEYGQALRFFGSKEYKDNNFTAKTYGELDAVLNDVQNGSGLRVIEVFMDREDVSGALSKKMERQVAQEKE